MGKDSPSTAELDRRRGQALRDKAVIGASDNAEAQSIFPWLWGHIWIRDIVIAGFGLLYGAGIAAMYSEQYAIAAGFYVVAISYGTAKVLRWEESKQLKQRGLASILILLVAASIASGSWKWIDSTRQQVEARAAKSRPIPAPVADPTKVAPVSPTESMPISAKEIDRRKGILNKLRIEYLKANKSKLGGPGEPKGDTGLPGGIVEGTEYPPAIWADQRLKDVGEQWTLEEFTAIPRHLYDLTELRRNQLLGFLKKNWELDFTSVAFKSKPVKDPRPTIKVGCMTSSDSACVMAGKVLPILSEAGWPIDSNRVYMLTPTIPVDSITVATRPTAQEDPKNLPPHLGTWHDATESETSLRYSFAQIEIPVRSSYDPSLPVGTLGLYFGPEPR